MITFLKIKNYKSLENVELKLGPLHVFVGTNGSGKSNLFDVFQFLLDATQDGSSAVHSRGGFSQLVWGGDLKRTISFELHASLPNEKAKAEHAVFQLEIAGGPQYYNITKERLSVFNNQGQEQPVLAFPTQQNYATITYLNGGKWEAPRTQNRLFLEHLLDEDRIGGAAKFVRQLQSWANYNFEPSVMRKPNAVKQDFHMQRSGENFSSVLHSIQSEHSGKFGKIESLLKTVLPELRHLFTALTKEGQTFASLAENSFPLKIPVWAMSDGTLRLLAQLAVLFAPEPPALTCFEEPENFLHPAWMALVADILKNTAIQNQILISTHSPYLLNHFSPDNLIVVEKKGGKSHFRTVTKKKGLKEALKVLGLGELWYSKELGGTP